ncbi:uncharacterized protein LOC141643447 [Silene latifolia]|uniref:uncharacterized protein LOC141643447 n=1 Tax=Silene latifolia TaxID=37657 RepID=UPI003D76EEE2
MADFSNTTPLIPPSPMIKPNLIDLEASSSYIQCRICLESDGTDFIAPCKCKGSSKFVHRECLDHWRSVKEGFAFAHCMTCEAPYYLTVHALPDKKWRTLKFRFFVTRDIIFIFLIVQLVIISLAYLVYVGDGYREFWLQHYWIFKNIMSFYYLCGALLFFALLGLSGCFITCFDTSVQNDLTQPCNEVCLCCCYPRAGANIYFPGNYYLWSNGGAFPGGQCECCGEGCCEGGTDAAGDCGSCDCGSCDCGSCFRDSGESGLPLVFIVALVVVILFAVIGIFYSVLVATMVGQRIWQRHYHILAKRILAKEYVVEDVGDKMTGSGWTPPPLPAEHVEQLNTLGLL